MRKTSHLSDIETFVAVADYGTLRAAAESLGVPPSTVSRSLKRLERSLNLLLVRRAPHGVILMDAGRQYLQACRRALRILHEGTELLDRRRSTPAGTIHVGCPLVVARDLLAPLLTRFTHEYPDLTVDLECYASGWDQEPKENCDVFFKIRPPKGSTRKVRSYPSSLRGLFAAPSYLQKAGTPANPADLILHRCVGWDPWTLTKGEKTVVPDIRFQISTSDPVVAMQLAMDGAGITILPLWMIAEPSVRNRLVRILEPWKLPPVTFCVLYSESSRLTPKINVFLKFMEAYIGTDRDPRLHGMRLKDCFAIS
jgi:LysR family transcriptional regulator, transcriptional activator for dmlA